MAASDKVNVQARLPPFILSFGQCHSFRATWISDHSQPCYGVGPGTRQDGEPQRGTDRLRIPAIVISQSA